MAKTVSDGLANTPHSLDQISDERLQWWRKPQLKYILETEDVECPSSALDVGVGEGHWSNLLFSNFDERCIAITGVDQENHWITASGEYLKKNLLGHCYAPELGCAYSLGVPGERFDIVTCQTLLMHLDRPGEALNEMCRVLKPGGVLLISEPLNQINMALTSLLLFVDKPRIGQTIWHFWLLYHSTLKRLGYGDHNIASHLPNLINQTRKIEKLSAYHSDVVEIDENNKNNIDGILSYLESDSKSQRALEDIGIEEFSTFKAALHELKEEPIIDCTSICWPQQNILFIGRKVAE